MATSTEELCKRFGHIPYLAYDNPKRWGEGSATIRCYMCGYIIKRWEEESPQREA